MTPRGAYLFCSLLLIVVAGCAAPADEAATDDGGYDTVVWLMDSVGPVPGHRVQVLGMPEVIDSPTGPALQFDGVDDGLVADVHPLAGAAEFTAEVIFRPDPGGAREQRFLHLQESATKDRILFETRMTPDGQWFLDTYVKTGGEGYTLFAKKNLHPFGPWYHAALVVEGGEMRHYVNGKLEMSRSIAFAPQRPGRTSIGVRINQVSWYKGAIHEARFTPRALSPDEFRSLPPSP